jgi:hypothetical protein
MDETNLLSLIRLWLDNICQITTKLLQYVSPKNLPTKQSLIKKASTPYLAFINSIVTGQAPSSSAWHSAHYVRSFQLLLGYPHSWSSIFILYTSWSSRFFSLYLFLPHSSILYIIIYPLWGLLIILSKYIHVRSSFEEFIEINSIVQLEFNLNFWFLSYNIFC